jgi:hypothetical protein
VTQFVSRALGQFVAQLGDGQVLIQVCVRRLTNGYELRHEADGAVEDDKLRVVRVPELRIVAQFTAAGAFRPLKSAPNLQQGWRCLIADEPALQSALDLLYPGALADWYAAEGDPVPVTHFREYTERQTGMYRITTLLSEAQAVAVVDGCCDRRFCLKRRLWTVNDAASADTRGKSIVPCLEPCALFLEFARKAVRLNQEPRVELALGAGDLDSLLCALEIAGCGATAEQREAEFSSATNPRRLQRLKALLKPYLTLASAKQQRAQPEK